MAKKYLLMDQFNDCAKLVNGKIWGIETTPRIYVNYDVDSIKVWFEFPDAGENGIGVPQLCVTMKNCGQSDVNDPTTAGYVLDEVVETFVQQETALFVFYATKDINKAKEVLDSNLSELECVKLKESIVNGEY